MTYLRQPWVHTRSAEFRWIHLFLRWSVTGVMIKKELELSDWEAYYQASEQRGQSPLLSRALNLISANEGSRQAVDLGCGAGMETRQLLAAGWDVLAIDREAGAYLPYLFGPAGFCVIRKPEELPRRLPLLYAQLTRT